MKLLKPGGRLGYISSNTFFKTGSGAPLRHFLRSRATLETVVDFGDHQIFEGVTTYPAILTMKAGEPPVGHNIRFWNVSELPAENFAEAFEEVADFVPQLDLDANCWILESERLRHIRQKISRNNPTLCEIFGPVHRGVVTGLNPAFIINQHQYDEIRTVDPRSSELIHPFQMGVNFSRWLDEGPPLFLIYIPKSQIDIDAYPAVRDWLLPFKEQLEKRATKQAWFELQQAQEAYLGKMRSPKIAYNRFLARAEFLYDARGKLINDAPYFIPTNEVWLTALCNSQVAWWMMIARSTRLRGGFFQLLAQHVEPLPIPPTTEAQKAELAALAEAAQTAAEARYKLQQDVTRRIADLSPPGKPAKLTDRLKAWWDLPDFAAFRAEVKKAFKSDIPLAERTDWENWIATTRPEIHALTAEIARIEREIDTKVYALFELTPEEICLLEASI